MLRRFISSRAVSLLGCNVVIHSYSNASSKNNSSGKGGSLKALTTHTPTNANISTFSPHDATTWGLSTSRSADAEARRLLPLLRPYLLPLYALMSDSDLEQSIAIYIRIKNYDVIYTMLSKKSPEEALKEHLAHYSSATMMDPEIYTPQRFGVEAVESKIFSLFHCKKRMKMQDTRAGVLIGASGVGKTYTALTYPTGKLRAAYATCGIRQITLYLGFNCDSRLTGNEGSYLTAPGNGEEKVFVLVLGRLVACLSVALRHPDDLERPDASDVHNYVGNVSADHLLEAPAGPLCNLLKKKVQEQLAMLCGTDSRETHILVNLDEIQFLDSIPMGARFGLRCLRELQLATNISMNGRVAIVGLATGIRPQVSLSDNTIGSNSTIDGRLTTLQDFVQIAEDVCRLRGLPFTERRRIAAALMYPRVRRMVNRFCDLPDINPEVAVDEGQTRQLLDAYVRGIPLDYAKIPNWCIHDNSTTTSAVPILDVAVWRRMLEVLSISTKSLPDPSFLEKSNTAVHFEESAFHVIRVMLQLFYQPPSCLPVLRKTAVAFRDANRPFAEALGLGPTDTVIVGDESFYVLTEAKSHYHPFDKGTDHNTAAKGPLSEDFQAALPQLKNGCAVVYYCGGDAPLDYIMLRRKGKTLTVWYGDAKYAISNKSVDYAAELCPKAALVHAGLSRELPKYLKGCTVSPKYTVCVVTTNKQAVSDGVKVLSAAQFQFQPFSDILFSVLH